MVETVWADLKPLQENSYECTPLIKLFPNRCVSVFVLNVAPGLPEMPLKFENGLGVLAFCDRCASWICISTFDQRNINYFH